MDRIDEINDSINPVAGKYHMIEADYCCGTSVSISRAG